MYGNYGFELIFIFLGSVTICVRENVKLKHFRNSSVEHSMVTFHDSLKNEGQNGDWAIRVRSTSIASEVALMSSSDRRSSHRQITTSFRLKGVYCARRGTQDWNPLWERLQRLTEESFQLTQPCLSKTKISEIICKTSSADPGQNSQGFNKQ